MALADQGSGLFQDELLQQWEIAKQAMRSAVSTGDAFLVDLATERLNELRDLFRRSGGDVNQLSEACAA